MDIKPAVRDDLDGIFEVAERALHEAYAGVLPPDSVRRETERLTGASLKEKLLAGELLLGIEDTGRIAAFVLIEDREDHTELTTLLAPLHPASEVTVQPFVDVVRARGFVFPLSSDIVLGNVAHERFHEEAGFVPGEVLEGDVEGRAVIRRRWWLIGDAA